MACKGCGLPLRTCMASKALDSWPPLDQAGEKVVSVTTKNLRVPIIHGNGTSKESLLAQIEAACRDIEKAGQTLQAAGPKTCDYLNAPDIEIWGTACRQHQDRMNKLTMVLAELNAIYWAIRRDERSGYTKYQTELE